MKILNHILAGLKQLLLRSLLLLVRFYQLFISPVIGSNCRFYPSCSHYCQDALHEHGPVSGSFLTLKRLLRCHPFHPGGFDPVPKKRS